MRDSKINFIFKRAVLLVLSISFLTACQEDQSYTASFEKPVVSLATTTYDVVEGDDVAVVLNTSYALNDDVVLQLFIEDNSTALDHEDFEVDLPTGEEGYIGGYEGYEWADPEGKTYKIVIPAGETSFTINIATLVDTDISNEFVTFRLAIAGNHTATLDPSSTTFTINLTNFVDDVVTFVGGWDKSFDYAGDAYSLCEIGFDMDFLYADASGNLIDYFGSYDQCPEIAEVSISEWGDGTWQVYNTVYDNGGLASAGVSPSFTIPVNLEYTRFGTTLVGTFVQPDALAYDSNALSDANADEVRYVYSFTISGNTVTVFDETTGIEIGTGRQVASPKATPVLKGLNRLVKRK
jgi:hypothetical protein